MKRSRRHSHGNGHLVIDVLAQHSNYAGYSPVGKLVATLVVIIATVIQTSMIWGIILLIGMSLLTIIGGGIPWKKYLRVLLIPMGFIIVSGLAIGIEYAKYKVSGVGVPFGSGYLCITKVSGFRALLVSSKAFGSVSCLYAYSLSTPMSKVIYGMRQMKIPEVIISLMYLMYRYIFVLLDTYYGMRMAAESRNGFGNYKRSVATTGLIYRNLMRRSYEHASKNFDAMESRCFQGKVDFLPYEEQSKRGNHHGRKK